MAPAQPARAIHSESKSGTGVALGIFQFPTPQRANIHTPDSQEKHPSYSGNSRVRNWSRKKFQTFIERKKTTSKWFQIGCVTVFDETRRGIAIPVGQWPFAEIPSNSAALTWWMCSCGSSVWYMIVMGLLFSGCGSRRCGKLLLLYKFDVGVVVIYPKFFGFYLFKKFYKIPGLNNLYLGRLY